MTVHTSHVHLRGLKRRPSPLNMFWTVTEEWEHDEVNPEVHKSTSIAGYGEEEESTATILKSS